MKKPEHVEVVNLSSLLVIKYTSSLDTQRVLGLVMRERGHCTFSNVTYTPGRINILNPGVMEVDDSDNLPFQSWWCLGSTLIFQGVNYVS